MKYKGYIKLEHEVEAENEEQAKEKIADYLGDVLLVGFDSSSVELESNNKGEGIPVSERLPKKNVWVLVTVEWDGNRFIDIMRRNYREEWTDNIDTYTNEITAWMEPIEPYKKGE